MDKPGIYRELKSRGLWFEVTEHGPVYNMEEISKVPLPYPEANAKNLFVRDKKRRDFYIITVRGDKRVDLKEFRQKNGTRYLTFASPEELLELLGLIPGAVTPFGLLNDREGRVQLFLDEELTAPPGLIGLHPNDNTATVWMKTADLIALLEEHGSTVRVVSI